MLTKSQTPTVHYIALTTINRIFDIYVYHDMTFVPAYYDSCYMPIGKRGGSGLASVVTSSSATSPIRVVNAAAATAAASTTATTSATHSREDLCASTGCSFNDDKSTSLLVADQQDEYCRCEMTPDDTVRANSVTSSSNGGGGGGGGNAKSTSSSRRTSMRTSRFLVKSLLHVKTAAAAAGGEPIREVNSTINEEQTSTATTTATTTATASSLCPSAPLALAESASNTTNTSPPTVCVHSSPARTKSTTTTTTMKSRVAKLMGRLHHHKNSKNDSNSKPISAQALDAPDELTTTISTTTTKSANCCPKSWPICCICGKRVIFKRVGSSKSREDEALKGASALLPTSSSSSPPPPPPPPPVPPLSPKDDGGNSVVATESSEPAQPLPVKQISMTSRATTTTTTNRQHPFKYLASNIEPACLLAIISERIRCLAKVDINASTIANTNNSNNSSANQQQQQQQANSSASSRTRIKCTPSVRTIHCADHCVAVLAARLFAMLCNEATFRQKVCAADSLAHFNAIVDILHPNNDPVSSSWNSLN